MILIPFLISNMQPNGNLVAYRTNTKPPAPLVSVDKNI